jgi:dipeptidase E
VPFQINPHYLDVNPSGHAGETREQRIEEFIEVNPEIYVAGLREGTMLLREDDKLMLKGKSNIRIFIKGQPPAELSPSDDLSFLLK